MVMDLFSLKGTTVKEVVPRSQEIVSNAIELIDSITDKPSSGGGITWTLNKAYQSTKDIKTNTYKAKINDELWASRFSTIDCAKEKIKYSDFLYGLTGAIKEEQSGLYSITDPYSHTSEEVHYISVLEKWERGDSSPVAVDAGGDIRGSWYDVELRYFFGSPLNHRHFSEVILVTLPIVDSESEVSYIVSFPKSNQRQFVSTDTRATYCSVEKIKYLKSKNQIEWSMGTASDAGGNLPRWLQNMSVCKSVSEDVPSYLNYLKSLST